MMISVRGAIPTFDVNQCSLGGSTFCFCLLRLGFAVTVAPGEHFGMRIHGVLSPARAEAVHCTGLTCHTAPSDSHCVVFRHGQKEPESEACETAGLPQVHVLLPRSLSLQRVSSGQRVRRVMIVCGAEERMSLKVALVTLRVFLPSGRDGPGALVTLCVLYGLDRHGPGTNKQVS